MKKLLSIILSLLMISSAFTGLNITVNASQISSTEISSSETDFTYELNMFGKAVISGYNGTDVDVVIPEFIDGYEVVAIGKSVFASNNSIVSVVIPDSVTEIGDWSFQYCRNLTSVTLPDRLEIIGMYAFCGCYNLSSIVMSDTVKEMGRGAFSRCTRLASVTLSRSLIEIPYNAFEFCDSLTSIKIPNAVRVIGDYAFKDCSGLIRMKLPVTSTIGSCAFYNCESLVSIVIPGQPIISTSVFYNVNPQFVIYGHQNYTAQSYAKKNNITFSTLSDPAEENGFQYEIDENGEAIITKYTGYNTQIVVPETINGHKVVTIGIDAFASLEVVSVELPDTITVIESYAFSSCYNLKNIVFPKKLDYIGSKAFLGCSNLTEISVPASVHCIGQSAFENCYNLKAFNVDSENKYYSSVDGVLYDKSCETLIVYPPQKSDSSYAVHPNTQIISESAFNVCNNLTSLDFGNNLVKICDSAFYYCYFLKEIELPETVIHIGKFAFSVCYVEKVVFKGKEFNPSYSYAEYAFSTSKDDFDIYGYLGSSSQDYATKNNINFVALDAVKGDMGGDGVVNINDVTDIQSYISGTDELTEKQLYAADVDGDSIVCVRDATYVQKYLVGIVNTL